MIYTIDQIRAIVSPIAASYGVKSLSLFGSYARGDATDESDIDLLLDRTGMKGGWVIGGFYADLSEALGKELDMVTTSAADASFLSKIQNDAVNLYSVEESHARQIA